MSTVQDVLDVSRHHEVFNSFDFNTNIEVIGAGATGSWLVLQLVKLGINPKLIRVWDFDTVDAPNLSNQIYDQSDVGKLKVDALKEHMLKIRPDAEIVTKSEAVDAKSKRELKGIVFLLTDTMSSRDDIVKNCLRLNPKIERVFETRMGKEMFRIFQFNPMYKFEVDIWYSFMCGDDEAEVSACGTSISVGPTAMMLSSFVSWQLIQYANGGTLNNETLFAIDPEPFLYTEVWEEKTNLTN